MATPLFLPRRAAATQPQYPPRIGGDPLARGLVSLAGLATSLTHDAVAGAWAITRSGTSPAVGVGPRGRGLESGAGSSGYISRSQPSAITTSTTQPLTFRYRLFVASIGAGQGGILQWAASASSSAPRYYARLSSTIPGIEFYYSTSGGVYRTQIALQEGVEYIITHTFDGTTHSVYLNGVYQGGFTGPWNNTGGGFYIGRGYNAPLGDWIVSDFAVWPRALDAGEVKADAANPWRVLAAPQRVLPIARSTSSALAGAPGTQANTGSTGAIGQTHQLAGSNAVQANAGTAGTVSEAAVLAGAPGSQANIAGAGAVSQTHVLASAGAVQANSGSTGSVSSNGLVAAPGTTQNVGSSGAIGQIHVLAGAPAQQANSGPGGAIAIASDPRYARPSADVAAGPWQPSTGTVLAAMIDEPSADVTDYIEATSAGPCEIALNPVTDPHTSSGQVVRYQAWSETGNGLTVSLKQGATTIASWTHNAGELPATPTIFAQSLTAAECDSITNYADLRFTFEAF